MSKFPNHQFFAYAKGILKPQKDSERGIYINRDELIAYDLDENGQEIIQKVELKNIKGIKDVYDFNFKFYLVRYKFRVYQAFEIYDHQDETVIYLQQKRMRPEWWIEFFQHLKMTMHGVEIDKPIQKAIESEKYFPILFRQILLTILGLLKGLIPFFILVSGFLFIVWVTGSWESVINS